MASQPASAGSTTPRKDAAPAASSSGAAASTASKLGFAEGLRGWCAMAVCWGHFTNFFILEHAQFLAELSVFIFFVLSGFVLSLSYMKKPSAGSLASSVVRRFFRLFWAAYMAIFLNFVAAKYGGFKGVPAILAAYGTTWGDTVLNPPHPRSVPSVLFDGFVSAWWETSHVYNRMVIWTMHYELIGSFAVFLLMAVAREVRNRWLVYLAAIVCMRFVPGVFVCFGFGVALADAYACGWFDSAEPVTVEAFQPPPALGDEEAAVPSVNSASSVSVGNDGAYAAAASGGVVVAFSGKGSGTLRTEQTPPAASSSPSAPASSSPPTYWSLPLPLPAACCRGRFQGMRWRPWLAAREAAALLLVFGLLAVLSTGAGDYSYFALLIVIATMRSSLLRWWFSTPFSLWIGKVSFSLYLIHPTVIGLLSTRLAVALKGAGLPFEGVYAATLAITILPLIPIVTAYERWVDRRGITLARFIAERFVVGPGPASSAASLPSVKPFSQGDILGFPPRMQAALRAALFDPSWRSVGGALAASARVVGLAASYVARGVATFCRDLARADGVLAGTGAALVLAHVGIAIADAVDPSFL